MSNHDRSPCKEALGYAGGSAATDEGMGHISQGIEIYRTRSARGTLHLLAMLGDAYLHAGRSDEGLAAVAEGLA